MQLKQCRLPFAFSSNVASTLRSIASVQFLSSNLVRKPASFPHARSHIRRLPSLTPRSTTLPRRTHILPSPHSLPPNPPRIHRRIRRPPIIRIIKATPHLFLRTLSQPIHRLLDKLFRVSADVLACGTVEAEVHEVRCCDGAGWGLPRGAGGETRHPGFVVTVVDVDVRELWVLESQIPLKLDFRKNPPDLLFPKNPVNVLPPPARVPQLNDHPSLHLVRPHQTRELLERLETVLRKLEALCKLKPNRAEMRAEDLGAAEEVGEMVAEVVVDAL